MLSEMSQREELERLPKNIVASTDVTYTHGRLKHNSTHGASAAISSSTKTIFSAIPISKSYGKTIGDVNCNTSQFESLALQYHVFTTHKKGKNVSAIVVDGDSSTNTTKQKIVKNLNIKHKIDSIPDVPHTKKGLPKKIYTYIQPQLVLNLKFINQRIHEIYSKYHPKTQNNKKLKRKKRGKKFENWERYDIDKMLLLEDRKKQFKLWKSTITHKYTRNLVKLLFRYAMYDVKIAEVPTLENVNEVKLKLNQVLNHVAPIDDHHSLCDPQKFNCKTRIGKSDNVSSTMGPKNLPVGRWINNKLREAVFGKNALNDGVIEGLLYKLTTSLNESWHHVLHSYANKRIFYGSKSWKQIVHRAVLQWNKPYQHPILIYKWFGITLSTKCINDLKKLHKINKTRRKRIQTHQFKLKKYQKKQGLKVDASFTKQNYKSGGFWNEFEKNNQEDVEMTSNNQNLSKNDSLMVDRS